MDRSPPYACVVLNPPFKLGMYALSLVSDLIRGNAANRVIALLPSDYFVNARSRMRAFHDLKLDIFREYRVGHWSYLDGSHTVKPTPDSIFIFRRSTRPRFSHRTLDVRLSGELTE